MNIQGDLFTEYYIPDSIILEIKQHLLLQPAVVAVGVDPEYDNSGDEFIITVVIADCDDDTYNTTAGYLFRYAEEINKRLATPIYFHPEWLQYPDNFTTSFLRSFIMQSTLKFFITRVAPNRNYIQIRIGDDDFAIEDLDHSETFLLQSWFDRNVADSNVVLAHNHLGWWLGFRECSKEVYLSQETLDERLQELATIEAAFFARLEYIKQPKF